MTATCSRLARLPRRRWRRLVRFPPPRPLLLLLLLLAAVGPAHGWESGDLELFDLVEEVQLNFYQFLGVQQVSGAAGPPEGCAYFGDSGAKTCRSGQKGGGGAGFDPVSSEGAGHPGQHLVIPGSGYPPHLGPPGSLSNPSRRICRPPPRPSPPCSSSQVPVSVTGWTVRRAWGGETFSYFCHSGGDPSTQLCWRKKEE